MSSKRKRNQGENNGSSRNLDGRRLRTITEAKALATYLATKPEMDKKEKEDRRKRWADVVDAAERREAEIKSGSKGRIDGRWVEEKEETGERTREAVLAAMRSGEYRDTLLGTSSGSSATADGEASGESGGEGVGESSSGATTPPLVSDAKGGQAQVYFGFDEDDEFMSDDEIDPAEAEEQAVTEGKGKGRA
jgi:hypothetical protein